MRVRFQNHHRYLFHCNKCGAKRMGRYYREQFDAMARLDCGHHRNFGYTLPDDYLEKMGLMNT